MIGINVDEDVQAAIRQGFIAFNEGLTKITYLCGKKHTENYRDPEEKVRAKYYIELIKKYQYAANRIEIEVTVPRRTPEDRADIVVYEDDERKLPYLVVECKKDGISSSEFTQAIEQAFGNANSIRAKYAIVVAGNTRTAFDVAGFKPNERERNVISDIPVKYGKAPKYRFIKGQADKELKEVTREDLIRTLEKAHDTVWQGGKLAPTVAFDEISKLLFCKLQDEKERTVTKKGDPYKFQIGTHERPEEVCERIDTIYDYAKSKDSEVFKEEINLEPKIVYSVVEHFQETSFSKTDLDTKGVAFERFMEDFFKGKMGQFFTPREIIRFVVSFIDPQENQLVLDPACGSGGFLLYCLDHIRLLAEAEYPQEEESKYRMWHDFAKDNLFGIEINDQIARVCKMNMIIHDDGHTNVINTDSLRDISEVTKIHNGFKRNNFDVILTNPPFGAVVKKSEHPYLQTYTLGKDRKTQKTEILFIEQCMNYLKEGTGILGIVLPDSIAVNKTMKDVREFIIEKSQILAIISLPDYAFKHYGADVKASLFFLRSFGQREKLNKYKIFMASADSVGYTATGKTDRNNDLPYILEKWIEHKAGKKISVKDEYKDKIYVVSSEELNSQRIDPKGYSPIFKKLKKSIETASMDKMPLSYFIKEYDSGDWGKGIYDEDANDEDIQCFVLRNTNFDNNFNLNYDDVAERLLEGEKVKKLQLNRNDILIEKSGGSPVQPVGRVALFTGDYNKSPVVFSNFLMRIKVDEEKIEPEYLFTYLHTMWRMGYMEYVQNQTTGIKNLLIDNFLEIPVIFEKNKDTQKKIAKEYIDSFNEAKKAIDKAHEEIEKSREITKGYFLK